MKALSRFFSNLSEKYLPDAYIFSVLLTFLVIGLAISFTNSTSLEVIGFWGDGLWSLLTFSMQMALILITGHCLAKTPLINFILEKFISKISNPKAGVVFITIFSIITCAINWGFGLITSGVLAVKLASKLKKVHFPLLISSAYSGFLVWHGGISGSIPLKLTNPTGTMGKVMEGVAIPLSDTIFSTMNLVIMITLLITLPIINLLLFEKEKVEDFKKIDEEILVEAIEAKNFKKTFSTQIEESGFLSKIFGLLGISYILIQLSSGAGLNLNLMNFLFLFLAIFLHRNSKELLTHFSDSVKASSGIILQFPMYAGIMGVMGASGLAALMSELFVSISGPITFPWFTYLSAGLVNFFVPSGGGQWAIQGPIMIPAAKELGVSLSKTAMAIAWGDAWTNMLQPFWAIPLLNLANIKLNKVMGYLVVNFIWAFVVTSTILFLPL